MPPIRLHNPNDDWPVPGYLLDNPRVDHNQIREVDQVAVQINLIPLYFYFSRYSL